MTPFSERVIKIIQSIPSGHVMTYGQIAKLAGNHRGARQVVRLLHSSSAKYELPWHRVVNAKGMIGMEEEQAKSIQQSLLEEESVVFDNKGKLDLKIYVYEPFFEDKI